MAAFATWLVFVTGALLGFVLGLLIGSKLIQNYTNERGTEQC